MSSDWITVQPSLKPLTEKLEPTIESVVSVIEVLLVVLNITQKVLNIIKAFLIGILDPLRPLVEQIIAEIRTLINDLRQLGIYMHGDYELFTAGDYYSDLVGGYEVYERRMLQRLLDASDPSRPNFSSNSAVVALFIYVSSGEVVLLIKLLQKLLTFFGQSVEGAPYAIPQTPEVLFSSENFLGKRIFIEPDKLTEPPSSMSVSWTYPQGGGIPFLNSPAPKAYLIHVSTIPDGFGVLFTQPKDDVSKELENLPFLSGAVIDPINNRPLRIYGGLDDINEYINSDDPRAPKMYLSIGPNTPLISSSDIERGMFGKTFSVDTGFFSKMSAGQPITAIFDVDDLPKHADITSSGVGEPYVPDVYYVRVRSCGEEKGGTLREPREHRDLFVVTSSAIRNSRMGVVVAEVEDVKTYTDVSPPVEVKVPSQKTLNYQKAVQTAIAVMILSRVDLDETTEDNRDKNKVAEGYLTGFEAIARPLLQKYNVGKSLYRENNPVSFRKKVFKVASEIQKYLQELSSPPESVIDALSGPINTLLTTTLSPYEKTILEALEDKSASKGIGGNPFCQGTSKSVLKIRYIKDYSGPRREPSFYFLDEDKTDDNLGSWIMGNGSCDLAPIIYTGSIQFLRNYFYYQNEQNPGDGSLWGASAKILGVAGVTPNVKDKGWLALRVMPQSFPQADAFLDKLEDFLEGILKSLESIADAIVAFIESIQARIYQLQALLEYIKALLESLVNMGLPGLGGLVLVTQGTAGVAGGLISSGNKPVTSPVDYSAGVVLISGGLPQIMFDLITAIFSGEEDA